MLTSKRQPEAVPTRRRWIGRWSRRSPVIAVTERPRCSTARGRAHAGEPAGPAAPVGAAALGEGEAAAAWGEGADEGNIEGARDMDDGNKEEEEEEEAPCCQRRSVPSVPKEAAICPGRTQIAATLEG